VIDNCRASHVLLEISLSLMAVCCITRLSLMYSKVQAIPPSVLKGNLYVTSKKESQPCREVSKEWERSDVLV
jgi:hypothetical protein